MSKKEMRYFDVHVFHSRKDGYSVFIQTDAIKGELFDEDDVINEAYNLAELDIEDVNYVDYVEEISQKEYKEAKRVV